ncbi:peptidase M10/serralysin-like protein, partial [Rhodobacter viridis]
FLTASDSTALQADQITDFTSGSDHIDLAAIDADTTLAGDQGFVFIDAAAFTGQAGELRLELAADGSAVLSGDVDGDGVADLVLHFATGSGAPVLADLML